MKQQSGSPKLTSSEAQLIQRLRQNPEIFARVQSSLDLVHAAEGPLKSADEVEETVIRELRQLGHSTMSQWATQAEVRVADELKSQDGTMRSRKKDADLVVRIWSGHRGLQGMDKLQPELYPPFGPALGRDPEGAVASPGAGANGLRMRTFLCARGQQRP